MATQRNRDIAKAIEIARLVDAGLEPLSPYDTADYLKTEGDIAAYLNAVMEDGDPELIAAALGDVARARARIAVKADSDCPPR
jgi:DNA-binding phage protein